MVDTKEARYTTLANWMRETGIRRPVVQGLIERGQIPAIQPGGRGSTWYIDTQAAKRFLADLEAQK